MDRRIPPSRIYPETTALVLVQKLIPVYSWEQSVIPFGQNGVLKKIQLIHLVIGDLNFGRVVLGVQGTFDS